MNKKESDKSVPILLSEIVALAKAEYEKEKDGRKIIAWLNEYSPMYYEYAGIKEYFEFLIDLNNELGEEAEVLRLNYLLHIICNANSQEGELDHSFQKAIKDQVREYYETEEDLPIIEKLLTLFYITNRVFEYAVTEALYNKLANKKYTEKKCYVDEKMNMSYFRQELLRACVWVIVTGSDNIEIEELVANLLSRLGHRVYLIHMPDTDKIYEGEASALNASIENKLEYPDINIIPAFLYRDKDDGKTDNVASILKYIWENIAPDSYINILGEELQIDKMSSMPSLNKYFSRLSKYESKLFNNNCCFAWAGNYLSYLEHLYGTSVKELVNQSEEVVFSIVIPARNSAKYLEHTIRTCLNQRFKGSYEVIISDNSEVGNHDIYELCQTFKDNRIRYIRPKSELFLAKSFEYAFLHAKGKYIIGMGSDDGIMPWSLEILYAVWEKYPEDEVLTWDIINYMHPGYTGGAWAANSFNTTTGYYKNEFTVSYTNVKNLLIKALSSPFVMYILPLLYINSGFKRSYFKTLLEKTGRLWDGICQDIYMGVVNSAIFNQILHIHYPLAIAGQSAISTGAEYNYLYTKNLKTQPKIPSGGVGLSSYEKLIPEYAMDYSVLYLNLMRAFARGIIGEWISGHIDFKKWFSYIVSQMKKDNISYDALMHRIRFAAWEHGEEFGNWFDTAIYSKAVQKEKENKTAKAMDYIQEGVTEEGGITLCLDKFGVTNIFELTKLLESILEL